MNNINHKAVPPSTTQHSHRAASDTLQSLVESGIKLTPMMEQYYQIKMAYPDALLLFRMGDFYEVFFEDADLTSRVLNIAKTHRGKLGESPIPMAGIPHHAATAYIDRLTAAGLKVAVCEQIENPEDAVGIVKRAVTQIVTPGLPYDIDKARAAENYYLASFFLPSSENANGSIVFLDFTTGEFFGQANLRSEQVQDLLLKHAPKEILVQKDFKTPLSPEQQAKFEQILDHLRCLKTTIATEYFSLEHTRAFISQLAPGIERDRMLKKEKGLMDLIGVLAYYINATQKTEDLSHIRPFRLLQNEGEMKITLPTLSGLEIFPKPGADYRESILGFMDKTKTAMGARALKKIFLAPLQSPNEIEGRQKGLQYLLEQPELLDQIRQQLNEVRDLDRILAKCSTGKANAGDLINLGRSLKIYFGIRSLVEGLKGKSPKKSNGPWSTWSKELSEKEQTLAQKLIADIEFAINDEFGASAEKGNLIKDGWNKERDRLARMNHKVQEELVKLEEKYKASTGISKLRIKSNSVNGFFIEVTKGQTERVPKNFERRQTLVNAERYTTPELEKFEKEVLSAEAKLQKLERSIFKEFVDEINVNNEIYFGLAFELAKLDVTQSLAFVAFQNNFCRPQLARQKQFKVEGAWHPLIKEKTENSFVTHDICLDDNYYFVLITGPNMAGKTTVMREVAIIQFLAQIGSWVPAKSAELGIVDQLFSRLGASDDIQKGQSTFMVEMSETAEILRHATDSSLVILDEVGRGTSTYDGLSIAWSLVEHLTHKTKSLTLFATHYHELIEVVEHIPGARNMTVEVHVDKDDVHFLYRLIEGGAAQSFGIYVAKLAGLPTEFLSRARSILQNLEENHNKDQSQNFDNKKKNSIEDNRFLPTIPLFDQDTLDQDLRNEMANLNNSKGAGDNDKGQKARLKRAKQLSFFEDLGQSPNLAGSQAKNKMVEEIERLRGLINNIDIGKTTPIEALLKLKELQDHTSLQ